MSDLNEVIFGQVRNYSRIQKTSWTPGIGGCLVCFIFYWLVATSGI